jgi:PEP-CTERM motif
MRNLLIGMVVLAAMTLGATTTKAQTQIALGTSTSGTITFSSSGSPASTVNVAFDDVGGAASTVPDSGLYTYTIAGGGLVNVTLTSAGAGYYTASNTSVPISILGGGGTLTGTLTLVDLLQLSSNGYVNIDPSVDANLVVTGATGVLAPYLSAGSGGLTITLNLGSTTAINLLNGSETVKVSNGNIMPSPEPSSMLLFGSGLLVFAGILRRQLRG